MVESVSHQVMVEVKGRIRQASILISTHMLLLSELPDCINTVAWRSADARYNPRNRGDEHLSAGRSGPSSVAA
jgi:hypothetical protein